LHQNLFMFYVWHRIGHIIIVWEDKDITVVTWGWVKNESKSAIWNLKETTVPVISTCIYVYPFSSSFSWMNDALNLTLRNLHSTNTNELEKLRAEEKHCYVQPHHPNIHSFGLCIHYSPFEWNNSHILTYSMIQSR
jgi:hypothetical protein